MTSGFRRLWLLVEGSDDERFVGAILVPQFSRVYDHVDIWQYSQEPPRKRVALLRSIQSMQADYLLLCDIDEFPCVTFKKQSLIEQLSELSADRIAVVVREIESWYIAGLDSTGLATLQLPDVDQPDLVTKEVFDTFIGGKGNHISTMIEILRRFDILVAQQRSPSFGYFVRKHLPTL